VAKVSQGDSMAMEEKPCSMAEVDEEDLDIRHCRGIKQEEPIMLMGIDAMELSEEEQEESRRSGLGGASIFHKEEVVFFDAAY